MTGNPDVDFLLEAGPRVFGADVPGEVRQEIARSASLNWYRDALKLMAQNEQAQMFAEIEHVSRENREIERKAVNGLGLPYYRCPLSVRLRFEDLYGRDCWQDEEFTEDFLKHHPGLRIKVTRGTRGQEYVMRDTRSGIRDKNIPHRGSRIADLAS